MALALFDRVQETTTTTGTGSITLAGAVPGFQSFAVVGNGNTCYYTIVDGSAWEVGTGTYSTSGPTLARTTVLSNSNGNTSPITLAAGTKSVFLTYPAGKSVNLNESGNVSPLGTVSSGVWQGSTVGVAYGGTGVTASSGANSVVLRDSNQNITANRVNQSNTNTTAAGGTTALTAASSYIHTLVGTGNQTYTLPDATTLTTGVAFVFNNLATGTLTIANYAGTTVGTVPSGGAAAVFLTLNSTVGGTWDIHAYLPEGVTFGTNAFNLGTSIITGGTWNGGTIATGYGGTGLTTYTSGGAVYANSSSTLTSGTLPTSAGGTGNTSGQAASTASSATFNSGGAGGASGSTFNGSGALTVSYNTIGAPSVSGTNATGTWGISISGNAATATLAATATSAPSYLPLAGGTMTGGISFLGTVYNNVGGARFFAGSSGYTYMYTNTNGFLWRNQADSTTVATLTDSGAFNAVGAITQNGSQVLTAGNYNSYAPTLTGTGATGTWAINITGSAGSAGSATTAVTLTSTQTNWNSTGVISNVVGMLAWKNYGNGHVIFDASASTSPSGTSISNTNPQNNWTGTYPTLMGWNGANTYGVRVDSARVADSAGSTDYNALTNKTGGTGTYTTSGDYRAPIFYDSNNTGYYLDPASTSNLNAVDVYGKLTAGFGVGRPASLNGSNWAARIGANDVYLVMNSLDDTASYGAAIQSMRTSDAASFPLLLNPNGGNVTVRQNSDMGYALGVNGTIYSNSQARAPIFYDSADTAYYGDFAGTSNLNALQTAGQVVIGGTFGNNSFNAVATTRLFFGGGNEPNTYFIGTNLENYGGNYTKLDLRWHTGIRMGARPGYGGIRFFEDETIGTQIFAIGKDGAFAQANQSMRAPIFYDLDNTSYYLDPTSNSVLTYANFLAATGGSDANGTVAIKIAGFSNYASLELGVQSNYPAFIRSYGNDIHYYSGHWRTAGSTASENHQHYWYTSQAGSTNWSVWKMQLDQTANLYVTGSVQAPIFYDYNNTGYYLDPSSTGTSMNAAGNVTIGNGGANTGLFINYGGGAGDYAVVGRCYQAGSNNSTIHVFSTAWQGGTLASTSAGSINLDGANGTTIGAWNNNDMWIDRSGNSQSRASSRAPIFYDSNNTAYYVDPASTSNVSGDFIVNHSGSSGIQLKSTTGTQSLWIRTGWDGAPTPSVLFNNVQFQSSGSSGGSFTFWSGNTLALTVTSDYAQGAGSLRAPIFYDSNNTGYYVDPASTSNLNGLTVSSSITGYVNGASFNNDSENAGNITNRVTTGFWQNSNATTGTGWPVNSGSWQHLLACTHSNDANYYSMQLAATFFDQGLFYRSTNGNGSTGWSRLVMYGNNYGSSIYGTIFYDSDNTAYYVDPNSTTAIRTVGSWRADSATWDGEFSGKIQYHSNNWYLQFAGSMIFRNPSGTNVMTCDTSGNVTFSGNVTAYSDARIKENVVTIDSALDKVLKLRGVYYNKIGNPERRVGVIAQETETVLPEVVRSVSDTNPSTGQTQELLAVDYGNIAGLLIEATKEQNQEVVDLRNRVAQLESLIHKLIGD